MQMKTTLFIAGVIASMAASAFAQDNYEIQVYPSETVDPGITMVELHSNYTPDGMTFTDGVRPTEDAVHETLEITHGFNQWFEIGFYVFTNIHAGYGWQWVGDHIRPRVRVPQSWNWPVGISLSAEVGYQRPQYSGDTWTLELRPIIDKDFSWVYLSFNPTFGLSFKGENQNKGFDFEPNLKVAFHVTRQIDLGAEYYGTTGPVFSPDPAQEQSHAIFAAIDLNVSPEWEFNFGPGWGLTRSTDGLVLKMILGRRFGG
jgi:hypothetical protein